MASVRELLREGDASVEQVKQIRTDIEHLTKQVTELMGDHRIETSGARDLSGTVIIMRGVPYAVKAKVRCQKVDLYALESDTSMVGCDDLCPQCHPKHVALASRRAFDASCEAIHARVGHA